MKTKIIKLGGQNIKLFANNQVFLPSKRSLFLARSLLNIDLKNKRVIDVGSGSGFLSIVCANLGAKEVLAIDINPQALFLTKKNWKLNRLKTKLFTKTSNVFDEINNSRWENHFDLIIANPPGLPTDVLDKLEINKFSQWMWNGSGNDGRLVLDKILTDGSKFLKVNGFIQFVHFSRMGFKTTNIILNKNFKKWFIVERKTFKLEKRFLPFIRFWQKDKGKIIQRGNSFFEEDKIIRVFR